MHCTTDGFHYNLACFLLYKHGKDFRLVNLKHILQLAGSFQAYQGKLCLASVPLLGIQQPNFCSNEQNIILTRQLTVI